MIHRFSGMLKWAKLKDPDEKYDRWGVNLYLDEDTLAAFNALHTEKEVKHDEDGPYVSFTRKTTQVVNGSEVKVKPPMVVDKDKNPLDPKSIGNGSYGTVAVDIYELKKGKYKGKMGTRLEGVMVTDLKVFDPSSYEKDPF